MTNITKYNKLLFCVKLVSLIALTTGIAGPALAVGPLPIKVLSEPRVAALCQQEFAQMLQNYRVALPEPDWQMVLRLTSCRQEVGQRAYWTSATRLDETLTRYVTGLEMQVWQADTLLWSRDVQPTRDIRLLGPEMRALGMNVLSVYQGQQTGLLQRQLSPLAERQVRLALYQEGLRWLERDLKLFIHSYHPVPPQTLKSDE